MLDRQDENRFCGMPAVVPCVVMRGTPAATPAGIKVVHGLDAGALLAVSVVKVAGRRVMVR